MLTETEAKTKWCPFVRTDSVGADCAFNRTTSKLEDYNLQCVASDCMAWRWILVKSTEEKRGYCGIAGKQDWS